jgi:soluble lytic murein transglycosylase
MIKHFGTLTYCFTFAILTILAHHILAHEALAATGQKQTSSGKHANDATPARGKQAPGTPKGPKSAHGTNDKRGKRTAGKVGRADVAQIPIPSPKPAPPLPGDLGAIKQALELVRNGQTAEATVVENMLDDEVAQKLIEWFVLRHPNGGASFRRYAAFIDENPNWPSMGQLRRRAEGRLWQEKSDAATVHRFTADQPLSGDGRLALARVLLNEGDRDGAAREVREAWRSQKLSERTEGGALQIFGDLLTREDHLARMDKRIGAKDLAGASRAAVRVGSDGAAIIKACTAVASNAENTPALLDAVSGDARHDLGFVLCRAQWLMRQNRIADATRVILEARPDTMTLQETDQWWRERRLLARKLLDQKEYQSAYQMVNKAAPPASETYRAEMYFMAGWIALRYLDDPATARAHFDHIDEGSTNPIVLARGNYWRGRAAEAAGDRDAMRAGYEVAARYPTAYYGQLARAKLGMDVVALREPPRPDPCYQPALVAKLLRAAEMLYAIGERDVVLYFAADLAEQSNDVMALSALGELTVRHDDAPAMLQLGKTALARGLPLELYAFPEIGIPRHNQIAPGIETGMIYSVARTESAFDQRDRSPAKAVGLMQVTPEAGRDTATRFGVTYDWNKLVSDPVYNTQMGAAELSALLREYRGSHIMTFAGYNAGRGRVQEWVKAYGDPRDPKVDAVDWVERIPFAETRNYVQRVMENLQVYRVRFNVTTPAISYLNLLRGNEETNSNRAGSVEASALP